MKPLRDRGIAWPDRPAAEPSIKPVVQPRPHLAGFFVKERK
jgi:hypothetical protein